MGNLRSVAQALMHVKSDTQEILITSDPAEIDRAERVVLPGQGAMPDCMHALQQSGLLEALQHALDNKPLLGVCVGEQMLFDRSQEGPADCLAHWPGDVVRFAPEHTTQRGLKVPHVGWNQVRQVQPHALWEGIREQSWFYFVHSYYVKPVNSMLVVGESHHGERFTSAVARDNIFATQFHPEKSARDGLTLYGNFLRWKP